MHKKRKGVSLLKFSSSSLSKLSARSVRSVRSVQSVQSEEHAIFPIPFDYSKRNIYEETILYFYSSMLQCIIKNKEENNNESKYSIGSAEKIIIGHSNNFRRTTSVAHFDSEEEIEPNSSSETRKISKSIENLIKPRKTIRASYRIQKSRSNLRLKRLNLNLVLSKTYNPNFWILDHTEENVKIEFTNGNVYIGTIFCNKLHGQGKYIWTNGTVYEGEFKNNEITGVGRFQYPDLSVYTGDVYKGNRHGSGHLFPSNCPCIYKGEFYLNMKHGFGWQLFDNNNTYEGEWANDHMDGEGIRKYPSGASYYGKFFMGKRHGFGVAVMTNNDVYSGEWALGNRDGFGDYIWNCNENHYFVVPVQSSYYGSWVDNKRDGIGVINFGMIGGSRYAGYFCNNEKHGSGVIICENGHVIESVPLFINDKPVHVTDYGDLVNSQVSVGIEEYSNTFGEVETTSTTTSSLSILSSSPNASVSNIISKDARKETLLTRFPLNKKSLNITPEEQTIEDSRRTLNENKCDYDEVFPKIIDQYSSLKIPLGVSSELIDLNVYIYKIIEQKPKISIMEENEKESGFFSRSRRSSVVTYSDYELHKSEERLIRKTIAKYLPQLKRIYYLYAKIGCIEENTNFQPWLMRIFFWQLYRDCKIPEKGLSLIDIDLLFSEKSTFGFYAVHNPFEIIYFSQFLESLLHVALELYREQFIYSYNGVLKQSFEFFMESDILPNAGHFKGSALFEYRDVIPINAAYSLYKSFGEPHTAKQLYSNICILKKKNSHSKYKMPTHEEPYIQFGRNVVNCGNKIFYFEDEEYFIPGVPMTTKIKSIFHQNTNKLYFLNTLGPIKIANILHSVCPRIKINKDIINFDYKVSFLEFYEVLLLCTQAIVQMQNKKLLKIRKYMQKEPDNKFRKKSKRKSSTSQKSKSAQG